MFGALLLWYVNGVFCWFCGRAYIPDSWISREFMSVGVPRKLYLNVLHMGCMSTSYIAISRKISYHYSNENGEAGCGVLFKITFSSS